MKLNPLRWAFSSFIYIANTIQAIADAIPCKLGRHDYQSIPPENFNIYYERLECTCQLIFRGLASVRPHLHYGAPSCKFNRVCMKCNKIDLRLDQAMVEIMAEQAEVDEEETRLQRAKRILKQFNEEQNN